MMRRSPHHSRRIQSIAVHTQSTPGIGDHARLHTHGIRPQPRSQPMSLTTALGDVRRRASIRLLTREIAAGLPSLGAQDGLGYGAAAHWDCPSNATSTSSRSRSGTAPTWSCPPGLPPADPQHDGIRCHMGPERPLTAVCGRFYNIYALPLFWGGEHQPRA